MDINITYPIRISLNWDFLDYKRSRNREEGTFRDEEYLIETEKYNIIVELDIRVIADEDGGDYWNPPSTDVISEDIEVYNVKVFDLEDEEVILTEKEYEEIRQTIIDSIEYE